jgi:FkbM family methyltransferase
MTGRAASVVLFLGTVAAVLKSKGDSKRSQPQKARRTIFVDVGGNDGSSAACIFQHFGGDSLSAVYTFEPNKKFGPLIARKMASHSNFELVPAAAWIQDGVLNFTSADGMEQSASVLPEKAALLKAARASPKWATRPGRVIVDSVPSLDLLGFLQKHVSPGDFLALKIDCEGCEYEVLERMHRLVPNLKELVSVLFMEWHANKFKGTPSQESFDQREIQLKNWLAYSGVPMVSSAWDAWRWMRLKKPLMGAQDPKRPSMGDAASLKASQELFAAALKSWHVAQGDPDRMNGPRGPDSTPQKPTGDTCRALIRKPLRSEYMSAYVGLDAAGAGPSYHRGIAAYNIGVGSHVQLHEAAMKGDPTYCSRIGFCACAFSTPLLTPPRLHIDGKCGEQLWIDHVTHNARMQRLAGGSGSEKAAALATDGYVWMRDFLSPATLDSLKTSVSSLDDPSTARKPYRGAFNSADDLFMNPNGRKEILFNEQLNQLVSDYLGPYARVDEAYLYRTKKNLANATGSALYHHDAVGHRLKLFVYLTDVAPQQATPIARGSHRQFYHGGYFRGSGKKNGNGHGKPSTMPMSRFSFEYVDAAFDVVRMEGRKGDAFIFDTNAIHRRSALLSPKDRDVLLVEFSSFALNMNRDGAHLAVCGWQPVGPYNVLGKPGTKGRHANGNIISLPSSMRKDTPTGATRDAVVKGTLVPEHLVHFV